MSGRSARVSIGIPAYNAERFIRETLDSIVGQSFGGLEIIISDNASTDGTADICREYAAKDSRIRYVRNARNVGAARNFNRVVELATAEYFKLANADDVCAADLVSKCVAVLDQNPEVVLCYGQTVLIDADGRALRMYEDGLDLRQPGARKRFGLAMSRTGLVNVLQGVLRTQALRRTGLLGSYVGSDVVLVAELALHGQFYELRERLFYRRLHGRAFSSLRSTESQQAYVDPGVKHAKGLHFWKLYREYVRAIGRAPLRAGEKARLLYLLMRRGITARNVLASELSEALRGMLGR